MIIQVMVVVKVKDKINIQTKEPNEPLYSGWSRNGLSFGHGSGYGSGTGFGYGKGDGFCAGKGDGYGDG